MQKVSEGTLLDSYTGERQVVRVYQDDQGIYRRVTAKLGTLDKPKEEHDEVWKRLDPSSIYPALNPKWKVFRAEEHSSLPELFTRSTTPMMHTSQDEGGRQSLAREVEFLEQVGHHHQENLCRYYGCVVKDGLVVGIQVEKFEITLNNAVINGEKLDADKVISDIRPALEYVESFGVFYCDLHPENIMLSRDRGWCLIDFGDVRPMGVFFPDHIGAPGWGFQNYVFDRSTKEITLANIRKFIETGLAPPEGANDGANDIQWDDSDDEMDETESIDLETGAGDTGVLDTWTANHEYNSHCTGGSQPHYEPAYNPYLWGRAAQNIHYPGNLQCHPHSTNYVTPLVPVTPYFNHACSQPYHQVATYGYTCYPGGYSAQNLNFPRDLRYYNGAMYNLNVWGHHPQSFGYPGGSQPRYDSMYYFNGWVPPPPRHYFNYPGHLQPPSAPYQWGMAVQSSSAPVIRQHGNEVVNEPHSVTILAEETSGAGHSKPPEAQELVTEQIHSSNGQ